MLAKLLSTFAGGNSVVSLFTLFVYLVSHGKSKQLQDQEVQYVYVSQKVLAIIFNTKCLSKSQIQNFRIKMYPQSPTELIEYQ